MWSTVTDRVAWSVGLSVTPVSPAKTAEHVEMPFGLWTRVGRKKQEFNRIRHVAPVCTISIVFARLRLRQCRRRHSAASCAKTAEPIDLRFGLWTRVGSRKHKFNHISQVAPMCPHGRAHWRHPANTTEPSVCGGDAVYVKLFRPLVLYITRFLSYLRNISRIHLHIQTTLLINYHRDSRLTSDDDDDDADDAGVASTYL